jgi:hypothetical protein
MRLRKAALTSNSSQSLLTTITAEVQLAVERALLEEHTMKKLSL